MTNIKSIALILLTAITSSNSTYALEPPANPLSEVSYYIETYGLMNPASSRAQRTQEIFKRIRLSADAPIGQTPSLKIINSDGKPWAMALPDGNIVLSQAALSICYQGVSSETGDARLAFVLGHEIAHLTNGDFWHQQIYFTAAGEPNNASMEKVRRTVRTMAGISNENGEEDWHNIVKTKELQADDGGFLFASIAGFRTDQIFSKNKNGEDFLNYWVKQTRTVKDKLHLGPQERSDYLRHRFHAITAQVAYFNAGVRLAHLGHLEDAKYFFKEFQKSFPASQVHNNLGYIHLQLARKHMPPNLRYRFWLNTVMENTPPLLVRSRSVEGEMPALARKHIDHAIEFLRRASKASPDSLSSSLNLATAYLYSGEFYQAQAVLRAVEKKVPDNQRTQELKALALYQQDEDIDMWPKAVEILSKLKSRSALYNLAQLYEERGRKDQAKHLRDQLVKKKHRIPDEYAAHLCKKLARNNCAPSDQTAQPPPIHVPLPLKGSINEKHIQKQLAKWSHNKRSIGSLPIDIFSNEEGNSYLAIDQHLTLAVFKKPSIKTATKLSQHYGQPIETEPLGNAEIWSYGKSWSALIEGDEVREIWVAQH